MNTTTTLIILGLALAWMIQYALAFWQMRRYYKRISQLRRLGTVSTGVAGSAWKRRQYAVLVVDKAHTIVHVEQLSGWTVFATLKPVSGLDGRPMSDLDGAAQALPVSPKLLLALQNAASYIKDAPGKKAEAAPSDEVSVRESAPAT